MELIPKEEFYKEVKIYYKMDGLKFYNLMKQLAGEYRHEITNLGYEKTIIEFRNKENEFVCLWAVPTKFFELELKQLFPKTKYTEPRHLPENTSTSKGCVAGAGLKGAI